MRPVVISAHALSDGSHLWDTLEVALDVTPAISGSTGIARYVTQLGAALERQGVGVRRFAVGRRAFPLPPAARHLPVPARVLERSWGIVPWPRAEQLAGGGSVVHATGALIPPTRKPLVVTVHDLAAVRHPELHPPLHARRQRAQLATLDRAAVIVAVSQATADDLAALGGRPAQIVIAPLGVTALPDAVPLAPHQRPARSYVLAVGETSPRKGYEILLRALARLDGGPDLVIVGPPAGDEDRLRTLIATLGLAQRVKRLGAVTDAQLAGLYGEAVALCFPSIAEGFGLPVLEAMAAGVPVLASDIPATREVADDAAVYLDAHDQQDWAEAVRAVASENGLRARLAAAGRRRAAQFTWERTATATLTAYRLALGG